MSKCRGISFPAVIPFQSAEVNISDGRHQKNIAVVGDACAAQMSVAKTIDDRVRVMIAGAAVPAGQARVGAELDHAEGHCCSGKRMSVSCCADERIDELR